MAKAKEEEKKTTKKPTTKKTITKESTPKKETTKSTPKKKEVVKEKDMNLMAKITLVALILFGSIFLFWPDQKTVNIALVICAVFSLTAAICGIIAKIQIKKSDEKGKGIALTGIIVGIIGFIISTYTLCVLEAIKDVKFNDPILCPTVQNCIKKENGISICEFEEELKIPCTTDKLTEGQFKK